jgi:hypothetical protein
MPRCEALQNALKLNSNAFEEQKYIQTVTIMQEWRMRSNKQLD